MTWFLKLRDAISTPIINIHSEKQALYYQILALKCYYVTRNLDVSRINQQNLTLFLTLISHCFIRPYLPQSFITFIFEALLLALPFVQRDRECVPSFVILMICCLIHPVLELVMDLCLMLSFLINVFLTMSRSASQRNYYRWELFVMTNLLYISGIDGLFDILILLTCWSVFLSSVHRDLNDAFFNTFIIFQVSGQLFDSTSSIQMQYERLNNSF